jgi:hypothetical protein
MRVSDDAPQSAPAEQEEPLAYALGKLTRFAIVAENPLI